MKRPSDPPAEAKPRRRLPVLRSDGKAQPPPEEDAPDRPGWHFVLIGAVVAVLTWLLLAALVNGLVGAWYRSQWTGPDDAPAAAAIGLVVINLVVFLIGAFVGGYFALRYGELSTHRHGVGAGILTGITGTALSMSGPAGGLDALSTAAAAAILIAGGGVAAHWGARRGAARRG